MWHSLVVTTCRASQALAFWIKKSLISFHSHHSQLLYDSQHLWRSTVRWCHQPINNTKLWLFLDFSSFVRWFLVKLKDQTEDVSQWNKTRNMCEMFKIVFPKGQWLKNHKLLDAHSLRVSLLSGSIGSNALEISFTCLYCRILSSCSIVAMPDFFVLPKPVERYSENQHT